MNELSNLFTPATVCKLSDAAVTKIAGETLESVNEREDLNKKFKVLQESMTALQRLRTFRGPGKLRSGKSGQRPNRRVETNAWLQKMQTPWQLMA